MVKIYTTDTCPKCIAAKQYFKEKGIKFEEINVLEDMIGREEMVKVSKQMSVPVININETIIVGFHKHKKKRIYKK